MKYKNAATHKNDNLYDSLESGDSHTVSHTVFVPHIQ